MQAPDSYAPRGQRHVLALGAEVALESLRAEGSPSLVQRPFDTPLRVVDRGAVCGLLGCGKLRDALHRFGERAVLAPEVLHAGGLERCIVRGRRDFGDRAVRELLQVFARHCVLQ